MSAKKKSEGHSRLTGKLHTMKSGGYSTDSERDSGFSDGAAAPQSLKALDPTDSEGSPRSGAQRGHPPSSGAGSQPSHLAVLGGSYPGLSPMILMNNVLLKQPCDTPPALKPWGFSPTVEVVQPVVQQPQVVFLQSVVSHQSPSVVPKEGSGKRRHPKKYLPILKSYPKIAPHPGDSSSSSGRGSLSSSSSSSLSGTERGRGLGSGHLKRRYRNKQQQQQRDVPSSGSSTPSLPAPLSPCLPPSPQPRLTISLNDSSACSSPSLSRSEFSPSPSAAPSSLSDLSHSHALSPSLHGGDGEDPDDDSGDPQGQKRMRFCNTYNILSKSGLLDITLRTKELIRQNRRTQNDLDRLRQDASRFFQALQSGDASIWGELLASAPGPEGEREKAGPEQLMGGAYQTQAKVRV